MLSTMIPCGKLSTSNFTSPSKPFRSTRIRAVIVVPGTLAASSAFAGLFAAQYVWDHRSADAGAPSWYPLLRQVLTGGVMIACLLLPLAGALRRF